MRRIRPRTMAAALTSLALTGGLLTTGPAASAATSSIIAAPNGTGSLCSEQAPCSLTTAQDRARAASAGGGAVDVLLRGGDYVLTQPLVLTPEDSGTQAAPVTYRAYGAETPSLSSAKALTGWTDAGNGVWSAPTAGADFRQLFVDGVRATPARYPNVGSNVQLQTSNRTNKTLSILQSQFATFADADLSQIDFVGQFQWGETFARLKSATAGAPSALGPLMDLTLQDEEAAILFQRPFPLLSDGSPVHFENAREFLDTPGEFFVDREAGQIFYMPRPGETRSSSFTVPALETLLEIRGTAEASVHDIAIQGITFQDTGWTRPTHHGYLNAQGGLYNLSANMQNQQYTDRPPAAVEVDRADRISVTGNTFRRTGSTALDLDTAVHDSTVTGNLITDVAGNGIMVGKFTDPDVEYHTPYNPADINEVTARVTVSNNVITGTGRVFLGTAGVNAGYVRNTSIVHNDISDSPWAGVTTGWGWTKEQTAQGQNTVAYNRIANVVNQLCDTAGIYHLSNDPGTSFTRNYIHDIVRTPTACTSAVSGFYLDEGSANMSVTDNVLADTDGWIQYNATGPNITNTGNVTENKQYIQTAGLEAPYRSLLSRTDLAAGRIVTSSSGSAAAAVDGDVSTGWMSASGDTTPWWQVDLGKATTLRQIDLTTRQDADQPNTRRDIELRASNDPSFATYTVLARRDGATIADAGTFTANVRDRGAYRYVRVAKTTTDPLYIAELRVQGSAGVVSTPAVPTFDPTTPMLLTNVNSGLVLDVDNRSTADGAEVQQWSRTGGTNQEWYLKRATGNLFMIVNVNSGKVLDNYISFGRGSLVRQWTPSGAAQQLWAIEARGDAYVLRSAKSAQVLDIGGASTSVGTRLSQWADVTQKNQEWRISPARPVSLTASASPRCVSGKVVLAIQTTNTGYGTADVKITSAAGTRSFAGVASTKTVSAAFSTRQTSIVAGEAQVSATETGTTSAPVTITAPYPALTCK